jgi:hypothetical protein
MQQIVIEIALPRDRKARASPDELLSPGIASLPGFKFLPEDSLEKQLLMEKFHNIIDLQGFTTNFLERHPDPNVHICEMRGINGYDIEDIVNKREAIYSEIYQKYGNNTKVIFHIDEKLTQWKFFPYASHLAKQFFEENISMIGFVFEPTMGMIECNFNATTTRGRALDPVDHWVNIFRDYNIIPKEFLLYNCNHALDRQIIRGVYEKYFNRYNITLMEPSPAFWYLTAAFDSNKPYFDDSNLLQEKLDEIEQVYGNPEYKFHKTFNCLNNKPRTYRIQFLEHLDNEGLLEDTDWSLGFSFKGIYNWGDKRKLPKKFLEKYKDVLPKAYEDDINEADFNQGFLAKQTKLQEHGTHGGQLRMLEKESYLDPFFTYHGLLGKSKYALVVETIGYHLVDENWSDEKLEQFMQEPIDNDFPIWNFDRTLLSEKTFKMIAAGIPSFILGTRYTVEHFKQLGFKFPWADMADYDHIRKFNKRSKKLATESYKFKKLDTKQFVDSIQHNVELFFDSERIAYEMYLPFYKWLND